MRSWCRICTAGTLCLGMASGALIAQPGRGRGNSVYTTLNLDRCVPLERPNDDTELWRCPGYHGTELMVLRRNGQFDLDAGEDNQVFESTDGRNALPNRVEWRLRGGRMRAIIYRLRLTEGGDAGRAIIGVETISRPGVWAGCLVAWIDGNTPRANARARVLAIGNYRRFQCGHNEPAEIPRRTPG